MRNYLLLIYILLPSLWVQYSGINSLLWDVDPTSITSIVVFISRNTSFMSTNDSYSRRPVVCTNDRWYWWAVPRSYSTSSSILVSEFLLRWYFHFFYLFSVRQQLFKIFHFFKIFHDRLSFCHLGSLLPLLFVIIILWFHSIIQLINS